MRVETLRRYRTPLSLSLVTISCFAFLFGSADSMQMPAPSTGGMNKAISLTPAVLDRVRASLWGIYIGDALAMPTHWYYDQRHLKNTFGEIKGYVAPKEKLPGSIMSLSNTGGGGRGSNQGSIVGDVILKGKKHFWERGGNYFYHRGMAAGENTVEGPITRLITNSMTEKKAFDVDDILAKYIALMTTPDAHNDTYCGTGHRMFFANWAKGKEPRKCPDNDGHNTDALDGLTNLPPVVFFSMMDGQAALTRDSKACVSLFRESDALRKYAPVVASLLVSLVNGTPLREAVENTGGAMGVSVARGVEQSRGQDPMTACYLPSSFPSMLHFAYKYAENPRQALLANTNTGGENVARGAVLGAVLGAGTGMKAWDDELIKGLVRHREIHQEIEAFIGALVALHGGKTAEL